MTEEPTTQEVYEKLKEKYSLPDYDSINNDFEVSLIDSKEFILRAIRSKMEDRAEAFAKIIDAILQPDATIIDLHECKEFDDKEKEELFALYMKLMYLRRDSNHLSIKCDDKSDAEFIVNFYKGYKPMKDKMLDITKKTRDSWEKTASVKEELGYMG